MTQAPKCQEPLQLIRVGITCDSFAAGWIIRLQNVAICTHALKTPMSVDANLAAGEGGCALVNVNASLAIILQLEPRAASALQGQQKVITCL